ncbi:Hypothetical predicted protein [Marmota monax]|uniref:Uncharacterized protein n=1 Tax=Marmota monax TaxID=9995 RepID=A0A5E4AXY6_MARMO|nr:hypothetical protein GHT09_010825 [Marmota monax]VTJ61690.1 Hypothetical predicted protein [Marmota monax]
MSSICRQELAPGQWWKQLSSGASRDRSCSTSEVEHCSVALDTAQRPPPKGSFVRASSLVWTDWYRWPPRQLRGCSLCRGPQWVVTQQHGHLHQSSQPQESVVPDSSLSPLCRAQVHRAPGPWLPWATSA